MQRLRATTAWSVAGVMVAAGAAVAVNLQVLDATNTTRTVAGGSIQTAEEVTRPKPAAAQAPTAPESVASGNSASAPTPTSAPDDRLTSNTASAVDGRTESRSAAGSLAALADVAQPASSSPTPSASTPSNSPPPTPNPSPSPSVEDPSPVGSPSARYRHRRHAARQAQQQLSALRARNQHRYDNWDD